MGELCCAAILRRASSDGTRRCLGELRLPSLRSTPPWTCATRHGWCASSSTSQAAQRYLEYVTTVCHTWQSKIGPSVCFQASCCLCRDQHGILAVKQNQQRCVVHGPCFCCANTVFAQCHILQGPTVLNSLLAMQGCSWACGLTKLNVCVNCD